MKTMKNYKVIYGMNTIISNSRNAKKHARDLGMDVIICTMSGRTVSAAKLDESGTPYNVAV